MDGHEELFNNLSKMYSRSVKMTQGILNTILTADSDYQKLRLRELLNNPPASPHRNTVISTVLYFYNSSNDERFEQVYDSLLEVLNEMEDINPVISTLLDQMISKLTGQNSDWVSLALECISIPLENLPAYRPNAGMLNGGVVISRWVNINETTALVEILNFTKEASHQQILNLNSAIKDAQLFSSVLEGSDGEQRKAQLENLRFAMIERAKQDSKL